MRALLLALLTCGMSAADRPWQQITDVSAAEAAAHFRTPPPEYGMVLWWGWDGPVTEEVITRDLDTFKACGFAGVMIEAGYAMPSPYLSQGWFDLVALAVKHAKERGLRVWVEDEGKYPSGFADGKFSRERPDLRMQGLAVAEKIPVEAGATLTRKLAPEVVGAIAVNLADNSSRSIEIKNGESRFTAPEGKWEVRIVDHQLRTSDTRAVTNLSRGKDKTNSLCDYLNPDATRQFLAWTHEGYKRAFGDEFGKTFLGFMGDEPDFAYTPWTSTILTTFEQRKGYDVRPYLASFFAPKPDEPARRAKADYWDVWSTLFSENFFRVQADWCAANSVQYIVHLNHEDVLMALARSEGDYFKDMRHVAVPGIDTIWNQIWFDKVSDFPKLASSAAHLFGRPRAFTESFAAYRTRPNVDQAKWVLDYELVRGINSVQIMFQPASSNGPRPPSGFVGDDRFPALAAYVNRLSYLLSVGRPAADIGVYLPTSSMWLGDEDADKTTLAIIQQLLERQRDFDFVDEQALSSVLSLDKGALRTLSGNAYRTILVPGAEVISQASLDRLRAFGKAGGRVVFLGRTPSLAAARTILHASAPGDLSWAFIEPAAEITPRVLSALPPPDVALDQPAHAVKYLHRRWRDADVYFLFNESDQRVECNATLAGKGAVQSWDAMSGRISTVTGATTDHDTVRLLLDLQPYATQLIVAGPATSLSASRSSTAYPAPSSSAAR
jgi:hypothetical protein